MEISRIIKIVVLFLFAIGSVCHPTNAQERGAKALFYDPNAAGTVQVSPDGRFKPSTTRLPGSEGGSGNPVSNYYENLNPGVMYWIELIRSGSGYVRRVSNDRVFRSGDRIRIHISVNSDGYLHALHNGSTGTARLMPVSNTNNGEVKMGGDYVVPSNGGWLRFDNNPGQEKVRLVFASMKSPSDLLHRMRQITVQSASTVPGQLFAMYNQYSSSQYNIAQVQTGNKDLIPVGHAQPASGYDQPGPRGYALSETVFNTHGASDFRVENSVYNAPANYAVNTRRDIREPVVVEISLNHHP